jgi:drug/metabolite transporter (DMT)-like permease
LKDATAATPGTRWSPPDPAGVARAESPERTPRALIACCFAVVWIVWGTTYLGIRIALEAMPPLLMASARFVMAGVALHAFARARGAAPATRGQWGNAALLGILFFTVGNGVVVWAERTVPSGVAALLVGAEPILVVLLERRWPGWIEAAGMAIATLGIVLLVGAPAPGTAGCAPGALLILAGCVGWALGSLRARTVDLPASPVLTAGMEMLAGGAALGLLAVLNGELRAFAPTAITARALGAFVYLVVLGSIVAFTAFQVLVRSVKPLLAATYAYVNPVVAVVAGVLVGREVLGARVLAAGLAIVFGVSLMTIAPAAARSRAGRRT